MTQDMVLNIESTDTPDTQESFTLTGLQLANQYWVCYRAVSDGGVNEASDSVLFYLQGKVNVPMGQSSDVCILDMDFLVAAGAFLDLGKKKLGLVTGQMKLLTVAGGMFGSEESRHAHEEDRELFWPFHSSMPVD
ncbi:hypothetical protein AOLI_G00237700 [Acnodon oligacanthus]